MVQQVKEAFSGYNEDWKKSEDEFKQRMDAMIELQHMRLEIERDHLNFEREKAGLATKSHRCV